MSRDTSAASILTYLFLTRNDSEEVWTATTAWELLRAKGYERSPVYLTEVLSRLCHPRRAERLIIDPVLHRFDHGKYKVLPGFLKKHRLSDEFYGEDWRVREGVWREVYREALHVEVL